MIYKLGENPVRDNFFKKIAHNNFKTSFPSNGRINVLDGEYKINMQTINITNEVEYKQNYGNYQATLNQWIKRINDVPMKALYNIYLLKTNIGLMTAFDFEGSCKNLFVITMDDVSEFFFTPIQRIRNLLKLKTDGKTQKTVIENIDFNRYCRSKNVIGELTSIHFGFFDKSITNLRINIKNDEYDDLFINGMKKLIDMRYYEQDGSGNKILNIINFGRNEDDEFYPYSFHCNSINMAEGVFAEK